MAETEHASVPEVNIGLIGHVDHGKTTLTEALSGTWTDRHSEEQKRGITIRIGYADITIRQCECSEERQYTTASVCSECGAEAQPVRTASLVDAPGHETLMANVLSGAAIMDGALLLVSADEACPQPQTREHLQVLEVTGLNNIVIVQNKIDAVSQERAEEHYKEIQEFVAGTVAENAPIVPVSALQHLNIDILVSMIEQHIPTPERDDSAQPEMDVARSFDVNRPGAEVEQLRGGVIGGSLLQGTFQQGEDIVIKPGFKQDGSWQPITASIRHLHHGEQAVDVARPGGLLAIETSLDPALTRADALSGQLVGRPDALPPTSDAITFAFTPLEVMHADIDPQIAMNEPLLLNIGTARTAGMVTRSDNVVEATLKIPACVRDGQTIAVSKMVSNRWRLIGYGVIQSES